MTYKLLDTYMGYPPIEAIVAAPAAATPYALPITPGEFVTAEDKVWGGGEFVFARAGGSIRSYGLCVLTPVWDATNLTYTWNATEVPNTANLGRELAVSPGLAMTTGQYGWFQINGLTPVNSSASVAADTTFGIAAAGQAGANTAGKQVLNARVVTPATQTVVKAATGDNADTRLNVANTDGFIIGGTVTGTNIGAAALVTFIDPMGKYILVSVANTAAVATNITETYTSGAVFYNVAHINRPFAQGAIT